MKNCVDQIWADYEKKRKMDEFAWGQYPNREQIAQITKKLHALVFFSNTREELEGNICQLRQELCSQLMAVCPSEEVDALCQAFFGRIPAIREKIETDLLAAFEGDPAASGYDEIVLAYPGLYAITVYRLAHELYLLSVPLIPRMMTEQAHSVTGIDIHPGATIGEYFFIDHGTGIVVGQTAVIGSHVKLYQGVTLGGISTRGGRNLEGKKRHPTLEDGVTIYAGATILGGDTVIGEGSTIGANAFVTESIPANTTVSIKPPELQLRSRERI